MPLVFSVEVADVGSSDWLIDTGGRWSERPNQEARQPHTHTQEESCIWGGSVPGKSKIKSQFPSHTQEILPCPLLAKRFSRPKHLKSNLKKRFQKLLTYIGQNQCNWGSNCFPCVVVFKNLSYILHGRCFKASGNLFITIRNEGCTSSTLIS